MARLRMRSIDFLKDVLERQALTNGELQVLLEKIVLTEAIDETGKTCVDIEIVWRDIE